MESKEIIYRKLSELKKLPNNPRKISKESFEKLCKSIKDNPDYFEARPIILSDRTGEFIIIAGNQRYDAAKKLGLKEVPTFLLKNLTEEKEHEIIIRDNVANGEWDYELLEDWDKVDLEECGLFYEKKNIEEKSYDNDFITRFEVVVECADENDQKEIFELIKTTGHQCRILTL